MEFFLTESGEVIGMDVSSRVFVKPVNGELVPYTPDVNTLVELFSASKVPDDTVRSYNLKSGIPS